MNDKAIVAGTAQGKVVKVDGPINFLGTVDKKTGAIKDKKIESVKDSILVFEHGIGSSVGAYTIYSLKSNGVAPVAMICKKADLTTASGCALADIPFVVVNQETYDILQNNKTVTVDVKYERVDITLQH